MATRAIANRSDLPPRILALMSSKIPRRRLTIMGNTANVDWNLAVRENEITRLQGVQDLKAAFQGAHGEGHDAGVGACAVREKRRRKDKRCE
jgi:hypothetical protein